MKPHVKSNEPRVDERIRGSEVRVISETGEVLGVLHPREGLRIARERGLNLVEVSPTATPPVAKIMDYGKYKYETSKRPRAKVVETKELKLRPNIGEHDLQVKMQQAKRFLAEGDPVQVIINFKGRENAHRDLGYTLTQRLVEGLNGFCRVDKPAALEGSHILMTLAPSKLAPPKVAPQATPSSPPALPAEAFAVG
jgi:translation initiation factor IF-3